MSNRTPSVQHELGYYFHPRRDPNAPGHPRLDVVLRPAPTHLHFDPEWVRLGVASTHGGIETLTAHHPWRGLGRRYRACAGQVTWADRKDKTVKAFTFGGELRIESEEAHTICVLTSPAPIIYFVRGNFVPTMLAIEVGTLLAKRRAEWVHDLGAFEKMLVAAAPLALYRACLEALKEKFQNFDPGAQNESIRQFVRFLDRETRTRQYTARSNTGTHILPHAPAFVYQESLTLDVGKP